MPSQVLKAAESDNITVVSTDIFDTLFLRSATSERRRFRDIACNVAKRLAEDGLCVDAKSLLYTRFEIQTAAYRAVETRRPPRDVRLQDIVSVQARLLGLPATSINPMVATEIETDLSTLKINHSLVSVLNRLRARGKRIVAVSDTYYSAAHLTSMMSRLIDDNPISRIYSSADFGATKKSGQLYRIVAATEGCPADRILHLGDDLGADFKMAVREGFSSLHTPRHPEIWMRRKVDALLQKVLKPTLSQRKTA